MSRRIGRLSLLIVLVLTAGCATGKLFVGIDVYSGPVNNDEEVQMNQLMGFVDGTKTLLLEEQTKIKKKIYEEWHCLEAPGRPCDRLKQAYEQCPLIQESSPEARDAALVLDDLEGVLRALLTRESLEAVENSTLAKCVPLLSLSNLSDHILYEGALGLFEDLEPVLFTTIGTQARTMLELETGFLYPPLASEIVSALREVDLGDLKDEMFDAQGQRCQQTNESGESECRTATDWLETFVAQGANAYKPYLSYDTPLIARALADSLSGPAAQALRRFAAAHAPRYQAYLRFQNTQDALLHNLQLKVTFSNGPETRKVELIGDKIQIDNFFAHHGLTADQQQEWKDLRTELLVLIQDFNTALKKIKAIESQIETAIKQSRDAGSEQTYTTAVASRSVDLNDLQEQVFKVVRKLQKRVATGRALQGAREAEGLDHLMTRWAQDPEDSALRSRLLRALTIYGEKLRSIAHNILYVRDPDQDRDENLVLLEAIGDYIVYAADLFSMKDEQNDGIPKQWYRELDGTMAALSALSRSGNEEDRAMYAKLRARLARRYAKWLACGDHKDCGTPPDAVDPIERIIAGLTVKLVDAQAEGSKTKVDAYKAALELAVERKAVIANLTPTRMYLRTSRPPSRFLGKWDKQEEIVKPPHPFQKTPPDLAILDAKFWTGINEVKLTAGGKSDMVLVKDDLGNWHLKHFKDDKEQIIEATFGTAVGVLEAALQGGGTSGAFKQMAKNAIKGFNPLEPQGMTSMQRQMTAVDEDRDVEILGIDRDYADKLSKVKGQADEAWENSEASEALGKAVDEFSASQGSSHAVAKECLGAEQPPEDFTEALQKHLTARREDVVAALRKALRDSLEHSAIPSVEDTAKKIDDAVGLETQKEKTDTLRALAKDLRGKIIAAAQKVSLKDGAGHAGKVEDAFKASVAEGWEATGAVCEDIGSKVWEAFKPTLESVFDQEGAKHKALVEAYSARLGKASSELQEARNEAEKKALYKYLSRLDVIARGLPGAEEKEEAKTE